ncbi:MAG TPA: glycosyltransferase family 4 protein [Candidatus Saccharimonadales bacterium]|nr:glycosyltransferase family 4 protein [Candidatus Saccharimonadales bacterium]
MASIKVAMIAPPWLAVPPEGYGGIENVLYALIPELRKLGVKVELFATGDSTLEADKNHSLYETGQYAFIHKPQYDSLPISVAHLLFALNTIREDGSFDVIHDHNGFLGPLAFAGASEDLPPFMHTIHGPSFTTPDRLELGIPDNLRMWREFGKVERVYFVPISQALADAAPKELQPRLLPVVHNMINVEQLPFVAKKDDYFITLARFHPEKGQAMAVKACLDLGYKLRMAGAVAGIKEPRKVIMELANPLSSLRGLNDFRYFSDQIFPHLSRQIRNMGEVGGEEKIKLISRAKALLFPIQWDEPFGMAAIEALACGTPVVAMNRGALPEIIEHGVNGFLANSFSEFKKYMQRIDQIDPAMCRESVTSKFSAEKVAQCYVDRYKTVINLAKRAKVRRMARKLVSV